MDITKYYAIPGELPLDNIKPDGGLFGIFRTVACIGDSLSSGEMESLTADGTRGYHDYFEYSWGQYMARAAGCKVYNFSRGGMTAKEYVDSFAEANDFWNPDKKAQAYILALGVNDLSWHHPAGSLDDIDIDNPENNNPETFAGNYGKIIARYKAIEPKARFFLMTMPRSADNPHVDVHADLLHKIAEKTPFTYVIDFARYAPVYDDEFRRNFYVGDHLNAAGYLITAQMTMTYIDWIIRNNPADFAQVPFIGKGGAHHIDYIW